MSEIKLAVFYSYTPNFLGFCGSQKQKDLSLMQRFIKGEVTENEIEPVLKKLEAAFFYYKLIAKKNNIKNPFSKKVVEAYWLGNELLEKVSKKDLKEMIERDFVKPHLLSSREAKKRTKLIPEGSKAHHSFHVFILGPIAGRIAMEEINIKDVCRIGFGKVVKTKKEGEKNFLIVNFSPVEKNKNEYFLGKEKEIKLDWNKNIISKVNIGDWVSFHWGMAVQVLDDKKVKNARRYTQNTLNLISKNKL